MRQYQLRSHNFENCLKTCRKISQQSPDISADGDFNIMQFAYKDTNNSISKHQLISHLQTPRTNTELDYEVAPAQQQDNSDATQKKICDYSPNSQTFFKPVDVVNAPSHNGQRQPSKN